MAPILLVEDNVSNMYVTRLMLAKYGYEILEAQSGAKALDLWMTCDVSLILMDIQMPEMNGWDLTQRIRALEKEKGSARTPIIALTAHAIAGYKEKCFEMGMDGYVTKPIIIGELVEAIESVFVDVDDLPS